MLWVTGGLFAVFVLPILVLIIIGTTIDHRSEVTTEVAAIGIPPGCREFQRSYTRAGIDTQSTRMISYACPNVQAGSLYDQLNARLTDHGYTRTNDSASGPQASYSYYAN